MNIKCAATQFLFQLYKVQFRFIPFEQFVSVSEHMQLSKKWVARVLQGLLGRSRDADKCKSSVAPPQKSLVRKRSGHSYFKSVAFYLVTL